MISNRMRYVVASIVGVHGLVYLTVIANPGLFNLWSGTSLLLGSFVTGGSLRTLFVGLSVIGGIGLFVSAIAIAAARRYPGLWRPLAVGAALVAIVSFAVFYDGQVAQLVNEGVIGLGLSAIILAGSVAFAKTFN